MIFLGGGEGLFNLHSGDSIKSGSVSQGQGIRGHRDNWNHSKCLPHKYCKIFIQPKNEWVLVLAFQFIQNLKISVYKFDNEFETSICSIWRSFFNNFHQIHFWNLKKIVHTYQLEMAREWKWNKKQQFSIR